MVTDNSSVMIVIQKR